MPATASQQSLTRHTSIIIIIVNDNLFIVCLFSFVFFGLPSATEQRQGSRRRPGGEAVQDEWTE